MSYLSSLFLALVSLSTRSRLRIALFSQLCCVIDADVLAIGVSHLVVFEPIRSITVHFINFGRNFAENWFAALDSFIFR